MPHPTSVGAKRSQVQEYWFTSVEDLTDCRLLLILILLWAGRQLWLVLAASLYLWPLRVRDSWDWRKEEEVEKSHQGRRKRSSRKIYYDGFELLLSLIPLTVPLHHRPQICKTNKSNSRFLSMSTSETKNTRFQLPKNVSVVWVWIGSQVLPRAEGQRETFFCLTR